MSPFAARSICGAIEAIGISSYDGAEHPPDDRRAARIFLIMIPAEDLSNVFVEVADSLVADFDLVDFLCNLSERSAAICGAMAVGVLLADQDGRLRYIAGSTEQAGLVELFEMQHSQGPSFDCFLSQVPVINSDLATAGSRWPLFAPRAIDAGFGSVHAIPMRLRSQVIGALNIFGHESGRFDSDEVRIIQALADVATIAILQERSVQMAESLSAQLQRALFSRIAIEQAKGALSSVRGVSTDEAFVMMRTYARANGRRLGAVAAAVVSDPGSMPSLTSPATDPQ